MKNTVEDELADLSLKESYKLLLSALNVSLLVSALLAIIVTCFLYNKLETLQLLAWFIAILVVSLIRFIVASRSQYNDRLTINTINKYLLYFRLGTLASGLVWGSIGLVFSSQLAPSDQVLITFTLAGLAFGASSSLAIDRPALLTFILPVLLPNAFYLIISGSWMGVMFLLYLFYSISVASKQRNNLRENYKLRLEAFHRESEFKALIEVSPIASSISEVGNITQPFTANQSYLDLFEYDDNRVMDHAATAYKIKPQQLSNALTRLQQGGKIINQLIELESENNKASKWGVASFLPIQYQHKPAIVTWIYDISEQKKMEEKVKHMAYHDSLTQLPNRELFNDRLHHALSLARRRNIRLAVFFIDLDHFKIINDTYGHEIGDKLLIAVTNSLLSKLRKTDTLCRLGGDEFLVLLPEISEINNAVDLAELLLAQITKTFDFGGKALSISASIGIAVYPDLGEDKQTLLKHADLAMYRAKNGGKGRVCLYQDELDNDTNISHLTRIPA